jgi:hypothetical protein
MVGVRTKPSQESKSFVASTNRKSSIVSIVVEDVVIEIFRRTPWQNPGSCRGEAES